MRRAFKRMDNRGEGRGRGCSRSAGTGAEGGHDGTLPVTGRSKRRSTERPRAGDAGLGMEMAVISPRAPVGSWRNTMGPACSSSSSDCAAEVGAAARDRDCRRSRSSRRPACNASMCPAIGASRDACAVAIVHCLERDDAPRIVAAMRGEPASVAADHRAAAARRARRSSSLFQMQACGTTSSPSEAEHGD